MAPFYHDGVSLAFDLHGCPQRCLHCWLGDCLPDARLTSEETFDIFLRIREEQSRDDSFGVRIGYYAPDFREPHGGDDYKALYAAADRINGCVLEKEKNFELLSLWRLNRDPEYASWARARGIRRCQMKVFGLRTVNDLFCGRPGAHEDLVNGTQILLENGIIPRWQVTLNRPGLEDLAGLVNLVADLRLEERVRALGEEFDIHVMPFDPDGRGFTNRRFGIIRGDGERIPAYLLGKTREHFGPDWSLGTEAEWLPQMTGRNLFPQEHSLWFFVDGNGDVFPNFMGPSSVWRLGNIRTDRWRDILLAYAEDAAPGLRMMASVTEADLAGIYAVPESPALYAGKDQVIALWMGRYCRERLSL